MAPGLAVRPLEAADREGWDPLWAGYLTFYEASLPPEVSDLTFRRLLDPAEPMTAFVAVRDGALVGLVHVVLHRSTWMAGHSLYLQDLFVSGAARGTGAGRALIERVYALADAHGYARVHWLTQDENRTARALYDRIGKRSGFTQYRRD